MKTGPVKKFLKDLSHNEIAMYLLLGIALINLLTYLQYNYFGGIIIFLFVGLLATHYTKNMVVILATTILVTNLLISLGFLSNLGYKEGMKGDKKNNNDEKDKTLDDDKDYDDHECEKHEDCDTGKCDMRDGRCVKGKSHDQKPHDQKPTDQKAAVKEAVKGMHDLSDPQTEKITKESGPKKSKSGFKNLDEEEEDSFNISNVNASQEQLMKEVQGQMTKLLGKNGLQNLDTNTLLKQQNELMEAMKNMEPLIGGANKMIEGLSKSPIGGMLGLKG